MGEAPIGGDLGDAFFGLGTTERLAHLCVARRPQITHRRGALEIAKTLDQGPPGHAGGRDDLGQADGHIEFASM